MNDRAFNGLAAELVPAILLAGEARDIAQNLAPYRAPDVAEALNSLDHELAARVLGAMPVAAAVQAFNEPHLNAPAKV